MHDGSSAEDGASLMEIIAMAFVLAVLVGAFTKQPKCSAENLTKQQKEQCDATTKSK